MEINNLANKKFKVMITKVLNGLRIKMGENSEDFNKKLENIKNQTEANYNTIMEIKTTRRNPHAFAGSPPSPPTTSA